MHMASTFHEIPNFTPFHQPVTNTTLWVYESFVNLEYFMRDVVWMNWQWRRLSPQFLPFTSPNH